MKGEYYKCKNCEYWYNSKNLCCPDCGVKKGRKKRKCKNNSCLQQIRTKLAHRVQFTNKKIIIVRQNIDDIELELTRENKQVTNKMLNQAYKTLLYQLGNYKIKEWELKIVRLRDSLEPLYFNYIVLQDVEYETKIKQAESIISEGTQIIDWYKKYPIIIDNQIEYISSNLLLCRKLEKDMVLRRTANSVATITNFPHTGKEEKSQSEIIQNNVLNKLINREHFMDSFNKVETEIIRFNVEEDLFNEYLK